MSDPNAPVAKHHRHAREHLEAVRARREAVQAQLAAQQAGDTQNAGQQPTTPPTEADQ